MPESKHRGQNPEIESLPRPYRRPRLLVYGPLRDLTAGGAGTQVERAQGQPPQKRP
jgi:hypothetical protein